MNAELFYADDRMVATTELGWLQFVFETLMGIFDRVGLQKNFLKTVGMVCIPFRVAGVRSYKAYTRRMKG